MDCSDDEVLTAYSVMEMGGLKHVPDELHRCERRRCMMWEYRRKRKLNARVGVHRDPVYVCRGSWRVHRCGEQCDYVEQTIEGYVCCLTGVTIGERHEHHESSKTDFWGRLVTSTHSRGSSMGSRRPSRREAESRRVREWTTKSVRLLFCSDARKKYYDTRIRKLGRESLVGGRVPTLTKVTYEMMMRVRKMPVTYNPPCAETDPRLDVLAGRIAVYGLKFSRLKRNQKTVHAFVCACVEMLRIGCTIGATEMVPVDEFVARHAPEELLHGPLGNMRCRYMTSASLLIIQSITSAAGLPLRHMRFGL
jgi:hypothetical protein